ncbi:MAG: hypothetical protein RLZZ227_2124 [Pseudomonadota bacterium]|jgi:folate-binding protein YgfZ
MHTFYLPPDNLDLITVSGPDAVKLLQGQVTCDVDAITDPGYARGALCNNKGRVLATFVLVRHSAVFYLVMNKGLGAVLAATLKKYLPFYKCEFRQFAPDDSVCVGIVGDAAARTLSEHALLPNDGECASLPSGWICTLSQKHQQYLIYGHEPRAGAANPTAGTPEDWIFTSLLSGIYPFVPDDVEKYTPQELHLDRHGFISFTKGCYTGQEIVARMHYRGKQKKLLFLLEAPLTHTPVSTDAFEIFDDEGHKLTSTLKVLRDDKSIYALVALPAEMEQVIRPTVKTMTGTQFSMRLF